ncbi:uncharacterized protein LOC121317951 [Polyodon spathula]|uniref:uncharacterized protein LOC121317951 n=1 Tax=Polyodon spathula TaxID=7913 RepID=UPI001B7E6F6B|nr:uncharacterized protein LOC121317951 [Polyodon spathula]
MEHRSYGSNEGNAPLLPKSQTGEQGSGSERRVQSCSLTKVFFVCLLASVITTALGVIVVVFTSPNRSETTDSKVLSNTLPPVDVKYKYLNHMDKSKLFQLEGGNVQWARYLKNPDRYSSREEQEFGDSINTEEAKMTASTLLMKPNGCRVPHWHFNANEHGYLVKGSAWIGILDAAPFAVTSFNVTAGQVIFLPRSTLHWLKCVGNEDCLFVLFFTTHEELITLEVNDVFHSTPKDIAARSLKPKGGIDFIKSFKPNGVQNVNLPPNLAQLVKKASYVQSVDSNVWRYFYDLKGSKQYKYPGGVMQWARYTTNLQNLSANEKIFGQSLHSHEDTLTIATMQILSNGMRQPHYHFNANEMGYVIRGCGKIGVISKSSIVTNFDINVGDVFFFPHGAQHYIKSTCDEDLFLVIAYSTGNELQTMSMDIYFQSTADFILAQLFRKPQEEFEKIPTFKIPQDINMP